MFSRLSQIRSSRFSRNTSGARSAFTLIELLLVLVILGVLAAVVVPKFTGRTEDAKIKACQAEMSGVMTALGTYEVDCGSYPTTDQGLLALVQNPGIDAWKRPYLPKVPVDPWGHDYIYRSPGSNGKDFDLMSMGPDGREGGGDDIDANR